MSHDKEYEQSKNAWKRLWARMLDLTIYNLVWFFLYYVLLNRLPIKNGVINFISTFIPYFFMLVVEPFFLRIWKTTPGKWVFGIKVEGMEGKSLTYAQGFNRTWRVFLWGQGLHIPIYSLVRMGISYRNVKKDLFLPWDMENKVLIKDRPKKAYGMGVLAYVLVFGVCFYIQEASILPKHRGALTVSEFAENYNSYVEYFGVYCGQRLNSDGKLEQDKLFQSIQRNTCLLSNLEITEEKGKVKAVVLQVEVNSQWIYGYEELMSAALMSFAASQEEVSWIDVWKNNMLELCGYSVYEKGFEFEINNIKVKAEVEKNGYENNAELGLIAKEGEEQYYHLTFSMWQGQESNKKVKTSNTPEDVYGVDSGILEMLGAKWYNNSMENVPTSYRIDGKNVGHRIYGIQSFVYYS